MSEGNWKSIAHEGAKATMRIVDGYQSRITRLLVLLDEAEEALAWVASLDEHPAVSRYAAHLIEKIEEEKSK